MSKAITNVWRATLRYARDSHLAKKGLRHTLKKEGGEKRLQEDIERHRLHIRRK